MHIEWHSVKSYHLTLYPRSHTLRRCSYIQYNFVDTVIEKPQSIFSTRIHLDGLPVLSSRLYRPKHFVARVHGVLHHLSQQYSSLRQHQSSRETCSLHHHILSMHVIVQTGSCKQRVGHITSFDCCRFCIPVFHVFDASHNEPVSYPRRPGIFSKIRSMVITDSFHIPNRADCNVYLVTELALVYLRKSKANHDSSTSSYGSLSK